MDPNTYSIISPDSKIPKIIENNQISASKMSIVSIKLTDELVEKLMKGQKDLNNLTDVEFIISNDGSMDVKTELFSE